MKKNNCKLQMQLQKKKFTPNSNELDVDAKWTLYWIIFVTPKLKKKKFS